MRYIRRAKSICFGVRICRACLDSRDLNFPTQWATICVWGFDWRVYFITVLVIGVNRSGGFCFLTSTGAPICEMVSSLVEFAGVSTMGGGWRRVDPPVDKGRVGICGETGVVGF